MAKTPKRLTKKQRRDQAFREVASTWTPFKKMDLPETYTSMPGCTISDELWVNSRYHVVLRQHFHPGLGADEKLTHLSIKRNDKKAIHDWRELQRIKNELCGEEREALEIYPAESRCVDLSNQLHLWVFPEGKMIPFGFFEGPMKGTPEEEFSG